MKNLILGFYLFAVFTVQLALAYDPIAGGIAIERQSQNLQSPPAVDLYNQQEKRIYFPHEVTELYESSQGKIDLSEIDPDPTTDVWTNKEISKSLKELNEEDQNLIEVNQNLDTVHYVDSLENAIGTHRFSIEKNVDMGGFSIPKTFTVYAGRNVHNILLRKNLLRLIGYKVPAIKYIKKIKIKFESKNQKEQFFTDFSNNTPLSDHKRWIISEKDDEVIMQDVIVTEPIEAIYNFALGYMDESIPQGRRLINSLIVPFNLVDIPESINQLQWSAGRIIGENVFLSHEYAESFQATWHDARWISRKILALSENRWNEIVDEAHLPPTIAVIVKAKLKSRRNSLTKLLSLDAEEFRLEANYTNGDCLLDNKVICQDWEGYGSRFAYGDPDSPLSSSEVTSFIKSKGWSTLLDAGVAAFNQGLDKLVHSGIPETDLAKISQGVLGNLTKNDKGVYPLTTWSAPLLQGRLILNRNLIAGAYLGTDNVLQLVDTIGFSVAGGVYAGAAGLPGFLNSTAIAGGSAIANLQRTYSHIKPISSVQKSLKYKFKNAAVPMLMRKYAKYFDQLASDQFNGLSSDEQSIKIDEALSLLTENMEVGESILISDVLGAGVNGQLNGKLYYVDLNVGVGADYMVLSRLHLYRKSENELQVYKDFGNLGSVSLSIKIGVMVPIISAKVTTSRGTAKTKFFSLKLSKNNPKLIENILALRSVLKSGSLDKIKALQKPYILKHNFEQSDKRFGIFTLRLNRIKNDTKFTVEAPGGQVKNFYRRYEGSSIGNDYQAYVNELFQYFTGKALGAELGISGLGGGNPGNSYEGKAKNKITTFESEILPGGKLGNHMVKITRIWNGWKMKREKAQKLLDKIKRRYQFRFFSEQIMHNIDKLFLYNINVNFHFYPEGIEHALKLSEAEVEKIFKNHNATFKPGASEPHKLFATAGHKRFLKNREKLLAFLETAYYDKISRELNDVLEIVEEKLTLEGMTKLFGGTENFFVYAKIDGFRDGNEDALNKFDFMTDPYISHSLGEFGDNGMSSLRGPFAEVLMKTGMTSSELTIQWILGRVY